MSGVTGWRVFVALAVLLPALASGSQDTAQNNADARYSENQFTLPPLASPKDAYVIVVLGPGPKDRKALTLPVGSTGLRVGPGVLPDGNSWTWLLKVNAAEPPPLNVLTPSPLQLDRGDLRSDTYPLSWSAVPKAARYRITGESTGTSVEKVDLSCLAIACGLKDAPFRNVPLKPGVEAKLKVTAVDEDGIVIAASDERTIQVAHTLASRAAASGFKVQRSDTLNKVDKAKGATFSQVSAEKDGAERSKAYQSEFALLYEGPARQEEKRKQRFWPTASLEGRLTSTGKDKAADAAKLRFGAYRMLAFDDNDGAELVVNIKYEIERKSETKKAAVELAFTPVFNALCVAKGINVGRSGVNCQPVDPNKGLPWFQATPVVVVGADLGKAVDVGTSSESKQTVQRFRASLRADIELNIISQWLGLPNLTAYYEGVRWYLPREDVMQHHRLRKGGLSLELGDGLSFEVSYAAGREAPAFKYARTVSAGFGIKFQ